MEQGWIKLHRKLLDDPIWLNSTSSQKVVLITLMLMANHAERKWEYNGRPYACMPGQMITSAKSIAKKAGNGITRQVIRRAIERFEKLGFLNQQSNQQNTLITINNWKTYQEGECKLNQPLAQQRANNEPMVNQSRTTNNNDNNVKNEKKHAPSSSKFLSFEEMEVQRVREKTLKMMKDLEDEYADKI